MGDALNYLCGVHNVILMRLFMDHSNITLGINKSFKKFVIPRYLYMHMYSETSDKGHSKRGKTKDKPNVYRCI